MSSIQRSTLEQSDEISPEIKSGRLSNSPAPILGHAAIIKQYEEMNVSWKGCVFHTEIYTRAVSRYVYRNKIWQTL